MNFRILFLLLAGSIAAQECTPTPSVENADNLVLKTDAPAQAKVAVVEIANGMDVKKTIMKLMEIEADDTIEGVLVTIDHAGGSVSTYCVIHDMIKEISVKKPVVGLLVGQALSSGYLVASASDYLIAHSMSELGSLGIFYEVTRFKDARFKDKEIEAELDKQMICAGKFKLVHNSFGPQVTEEIRNYVQSNAQAVYTQLINTVAHNRKIDVERSSEWADGRFFISPQALKLGLIDEIGTIFSAKTKMQELIQARKKSETSTDIVLLFDTK